MRAKLVAPVVLIVLSLLSNSANAFSFGSFGYNKVFVMGSNEDRRVTISFFTLENDEIVVRMYAHYDKDDIKVEVHPEEFTISKKAELDRWVALGNEYVPVKDVTVEIKTRSKMSKNEYQVVVTAVATKVNKGNFQGVTAKVSQAREFVYKIIPRERRLTPFQILRNTTANFTSMVAPIIKIFSSSGILAAPKTGEVLVKEIKRNVSERNEPTNLGGFANETTQNYYELERKKISSEKIIQTIIFFALLTGLAFVIK